MATTTYSFNDIYCVLSHPSFPAYTVNGQGVGEISFTYADDNTIHERAADGSVMISKVKADNGTITISVQQTSDLHKWLKRFFNFLHLQSSASWAEMMINLSSPAGLFDTIVAVGVSPTKRADQPYQAQGQMVTWSFHAANIQHVL